MYKDPLRSGLMMHICSPSTASIQSGKFARVLNSSAIVIHVFLSGIRIHFSFKILQINLHTVQTISQTVLLPILKL